MSGLMRRIGPQHVREFALRDLQPGMIVSEGVILWIEGDTYVTPAGRFLVDPGPVAVYATIEPEMIAILIDAVKEATP